MKRTKYSIGPHVKPKTGFNETMWEMEQGAFLEDSVDVVEDVGLLEHLD